MRIAGATTASTDVKPLLPPKFFSTLLELIKPLGQNQALVSLQGLGEVTLSIKEPLEASTLYHATILKDKSGFTLAEAFKLPIELKKILALKPLMNIEQFLNQLSKGKSPQKIATETITALLLQSQDKEEIKESLSQLLQLLQSHEATIPLSYDNETAYLKFKKNSKKEDRYKVPFEAYFQTLGIISGYVSFFKQKKEAHLNVLTQQTKERLLLEAKSLPMELFIKVDTNITLKPQTSLLDIQA